MSKSNGTMSIVRIVRVGVPDAAPLSGTIVAPPRIAVCNAFGSGGDVANCGGTTRSTWTKSPDTTNDPPTAGQSQSATWSTLSTPHVMRARMFVGGPNVGGGPCGGG